MLEELSVLIRLQEIDNKLRELEEEKGDLPEQIEKLTHEINGYQSKIDENTAKSEDLIAEDKRIRIELQEINDRQNKSKGTIFSVKTNREYDAISSEIEQAKIAVDRCENRLIEIEILKDELNDATAELNDNLSDVQKVLDERLAEMKEKTDSTSEITNLLTHDREKGVVRLKKPISAHYDRIRKIRDGVGVSHLVGNACNYCYAVIPPQRVAEINKMNDLILCEVCGCIIVSADSASGISD